MEFHPIAEVWPLLEDDALRALSDDIKANGQSVPIVTYEGKILDGRNRYRACEIAGVEPRFEEYTGPNPIFKAISLNEQRRHLTASQRALIAARLANVAKGRPPKENAGNPALTQAQASAVMGVDRSTLQAATVVQDEASPALQKAVEQGRIAVTTAAKLTNLTPLEQAEVVKLVDKAEIVARAKAAEEQKRQREAASAESKAKDRNPPQPAPYITLTRWKATLAPARKQILMPVAEHGKSFNKQDSDLIDWAQWSWNPVTGCLHDCPYCYARDIAERFYEGHGFEPTLHPGRLLAPTKTKVPERAKEDVRYRNVFTCSMADLFGRWTPAEWINAVLKAARTAPQWNFLFLTKFPKRMSEFDIPRNAWMGTTVDCQARVTNAENAFEKVRCDVRWLSVEPLIEPLKFSRLDLFDWIVIGGASRSSQTPEWFPPLSWVADLEAQAREAGCRVYHKPNLFAKPRREMPWDEAAPTPDRAPDSFHYLGRKAGEGD
jgi:protein gp37/ParB-like chromosome segregation protein Spo0J